MRKKVYAGILFSMILLMGCGNSAKTIEGEVAAKENGAGTETADGASKTDDGSKEPEGTGADYKGYAFVYDGITMEMDADAAPVIEELGEADFYFEAPSCAFEGIDKLYTYGSFELDTYPTGEKDYISTIIFKDDTITTTEGIGIGDPVAKMEEIYGTGWVDEDGMAVYEKDGMKLCFIIEEDNIVSVEYRSGVMGDQ